MSIVKIEEVNECHNIQYIPIHSFNVDYSNVHVWWILYSPCIYKKNKFLRILERVLWGIDRGYSLKASNIKQGRGCEAIWRWKIHKFYVLITVILMNKIKQIQYKLKLNSCKITLILKSNHQHFITRDQKQIMQYWKSWLLRILLFLVLLSSLSLSSASTLCTSSDKASIRLRIKEMKGKSTTKEEKKI